MNLYDCHLHTAFSGDSDTPPEEMVERARDIGLSGITITDHLDLKYKHDPGLFDLDLPAYREGVSTLKEKYGSPAFKILFGVELGLKTNCLAEHRKVLADNSFDFVIGSIHEVDGLDPYYPEFYTSRSAEASINAYFDCMLENIKAFHDFDSLGHLDYIARYTAKNYGPLEGTLSYEKYADRIDEILKWLIANGKALEVNTGSFRNGMTEPNPSYRILSRYYELGGREITLGADAHTPATIADHFEEVAAKLQEIGFSYYSVFKKRKPIHITFKEYSPKKSAPIV